MNVRCASLITMRSGFITSRIEECERSRRISLISIRLVTSSSTSDSTSLPGSGRSNIVRAIGRAAVMRRFSHGNTLSSHQRATSGKESSRSVSPVGAQSTTITSNSPDSWWRLSCSREKISSIPGGTVSSSARMRSTPRSDSTPPSQRCTAFQWRSSSASACTSWPQRFSATGVGSAPSWVSSESERLCAGSVDKITVRRPLRATWRAVAAATLVLPTPPLPV